MTTTGRDKPSHACTYVDTQSNACVHRTTAVPDERRETTNNQQQQPVYRTDDRRHRRGGWCLALRAATIGVIDARHHGQREVFEQRETATSPSSFLSFHACRASCWPSGAPQCALPSGEVKTTSNPPKETSS
jgi:hypothetical protein